MSSRPIIPVATRIWHGNDLYPLPPNYFQVLAHDPEAARQIRVNACRQWLVPRREIQKILRQAVTNWDRLSEAEKVHLIEAYRAEAFVASVRFFDEWYLKPDSEADFDPLFYDMDPLPTPDFHWDMLRDFAVNPMALDVAPRGSGKSMSIRKPMLMTMVSRWNYKILYCTSSEKVATETAQMIRFQSYNNQRIQDDWRPEMPDNTIRPRRGDAPTGLEEFALGNGSTLATYSVRSKMRGKRPRWFVLDDPEFDPQASTSLPELRTYMHRLIFKIAMPMVMRAEAKLSWLATFVSKRHYAWLAMQTEPVLQTDGTVIQKAKVEQFDEWKRRIIKACWTDESGKLHSCWPHMWPASVEERDALGVDPGTPTLADVERRIGRANFNSEYMANPGSDDDGYFKINDKDHSWWLLKSSVDEDFYKNPKKSQAVIKWNNGDKEESAKLSDFLVSCKLFITVDTSKTAKADSDFKVATLMATNKDQDLFVLDCWAGRVQQERLIAAAFDMADRWGCRLIAPEEVEDGIQLSRTMKNMVARRMAMDPKAAATAPLVKGFNPGYTRKNTKIAALVMRFEHGKIKLPFWARLRQPWVEMFNQIEGFNPDSEDGGLQNDDHLDTVSMSEFVYGTKVRSDSVGAQEETNIMKLIESGQKFDKSGTPLVQHLDLATMDSDQLRILIKAAFRPPPGGSVV